MRKIAIISGGGGQDASYLAEHLLSDNYEVHVFEKSKKRSECRFVPKNVAWYQGDICDFSFVENLFAELKPTRIFNLAAQSEVRLSCDLPHVTTNVNAAGALNMLEAFRRVCPEARFYQAGSSEMFGASCDKDGFQREDTIMKPLTPYGISKLYAHQMCDYYRNQFQLFISSGILFNHESSRRKETFLTAKVVKRAIEISLGMEKELRVGNLNVSRDWGHSKDYTKSMILMLDYLPKDFVISSGKSYTVEYLIEYVFSYIGLDYKNYIVQDPALMRAIDQKVVCGDSTKARLELGWKPEFSFQDMLIEMIEFWKGELYGPHLGGCFIGGTFGDNGTYAPQVWDRIIAVHNPKTVIDVGCGCGYSLKYFLDKNLDGIGIEGYDEAIKHSPVKDNIIKHDYSLAPFVPSSDFDLAWTCEFVEHVEEKYVDNFMQTFQKCKIVAMTHGVPGQPGFHHVNCRNASYWIQMFNKYGFEYLEQESLDCRQLLYEKDGTCVPNGGHVRNTLMLFRRKT